MSEHRYGPDDFFGRPNIEGLTASPESLPRARGPAWPDYRGGVFVPGERWGAVPPYLQRQYPMPPPATEERPYPETYPEQIPEALSRDLWTGDDETFCNQQRVAVTAGTKTAVVTINLQTRLSGYELLLEQMAGELVTPVIGGADVEDLTWSLEVDGQPTELFPAWSGAWAPIQFPRHVNVRIANYQTLTLSVTPAAGFPADNRVKGLLIGKARITGRPGQITEGTLRR